MYQLYEPREVMIFHGIETRMVHQKSKHERLNGNVSSAVKAAWAWCNFSCVSKEDKQVFPKGVHDILTFLPVDVGSVLVSCSRDKMTLDPWST